MDDLEIIVRFLTRKADSSLFQSIPTGSGTSRESYLMEAESSLGGLSRQKREVEISPPSIAKYKNAWSYTSAPSYEFMEFTGITLHTYIIQERFALRLRLLTRQS
jgi:hypothetical protein